MITRYYYSIHDILECPAIALVYTNEQLIQSEIPNYSVEDGRFTELFIINKTGDKFIGDLVSEGLSDKFKFNYILILNNIGEVRAFVELDSTIDTTKLQTETIEISFDYDIVSKEFINELRIDFTSHIHNTKKVHKKLFEVEDYSKRAIDRNSLGIIESNNQPFTSDLVYFLDKEDNILRYSGKLITSKGIIKGNSFDITDIYESYKRSYKDVIKKFITLNWNEYKDQQALVLYYSNTKILELRFSIESGLESIKIELPFNMVEISNDYIIDNQFLYLMVDILNNDFSQSRIFDQERKIIINDLSKVAYFYKTENNDLSKKIEFSSSGLKNILSKLSYPDKIGVLEHITEGLAISYIEQNNKKYTILNSFIPIKDDQVIPVVSDVKVMDYLENIVILSNRLILGYRNGYYYLYELSNEYDSYVWREILLGNENYLKHIHHLAKNNITTPFSRLTTYSYKGLLYTINRYNNKTYLNSI